MKTFNIITLNHRDARPCATLTYDSQTDTYSAVIAPWAGEQDIPAVFAPFLAEKTVPDKWVRRWISDRVVPAERQNLGEVLRSNGLDAYDALVLLESTRGESASDDFIVVPVDVGSAQDAEAAGTAIHEVVARAVKSARKQAGISQEELSERTGLKQSQLSAIENGRANPTVETLATIAAGLGMTAHVVFE